MALMNQVHFESTLHVVRHLLVRMEKMGQERRPSDKRCIIQEYFEQVRKPLVEEELHSLFDGWHVVV
jgi:hypothetical protein